MAHPLHATSSANGLRWLGRNRVWLGLFAPAALLVVVRWWLDFQLDTAGLELPPALALASTPGEVMQSVAMGGVGVLLLAGLVIWLMRPAQHALQKRRQAVVLRGLLVLWVVLWLGGTTGVVRNHLNRLNLQAQRELVLPLVGQQTRKPSVRSPGGVKVFLDWPDGGGLHTLMLENPLPHAVPERGALVLQLAPGRWSGWFVTSWAPQPDPTVSAPSTQPTPDRTTP